MAYLEPVEVTLSLAVANVGRASFGIPIFVGNHTYFTERTRTYTSMQGVIEDLPSTSDEYIAANGAFSQSPPPSQIKIGRRAVDTTTLTPDAVTAIGQVYQVAVTGTDGVKVTATFVTTTGSEAATDVVSALTAGLAGVVGVTVGGTTTVTLAKSGVDEFSISGLKRMPASFDTTENAADLVAAIEVNDNEWYFMATNDHSTTFIDEMSQAIESRFKQYWFSSQDPANLLSTVGVDVDDVIGIASNNAYLRTTGWFHDEADTVFPEMAYIAVGAVYDPGLIDWANNVVASAGGVAFDPATGKELTITQKTNLVAKNGNFIETRGGEKGTSAQSGRMANGVDVYLVREMDFQYARVTEDLTTFMLNQKKTSYSDFGINAAKGVVANTLDAMVETEKTSNILRRDPYPYILNFPLAANVSPADKASGVLTASYDAFLAGSIKTIKITGVLSF